MAKKPKRPRDPNQLGKLIVDLATGASKDSAPVHSGRRKAGKKGATARAAKLTPDKRSEIAHLAAQARWKIGR